MSSLRARLIGLVLLAFLPGLGLILATGLQQRQQVGSEVRANALRLAKLAAGDHERLVEGTRQLLVALAQLPEVRRRDARACSTLFASLLGEYPQYANLGGIAPDGRVFCSGLAMPGPTSLADRRYFREAVETLGFSVGEYQVGRITRRASVNFGYPVLDGRTRVLAVVFAAVDLAWVNQLAARAQLPPGSTLMLVDRGGTIFARHPDPERWTGKPGGDVPIIRTALAEGEGTTEAPGEDGVRRLYGFTPLAGDSAFVVAGVPSEVAFAAVHRGLRGNLVGIGVVALVVSLVTRLFANAFILRPAGQLVRAAERLKVGDLGARVGPAYGPGELGQLGRAFDDMAAGLEARQAELARVNRALRVLSAGNRALVAATEEPGLLQSVCRTIVEVGGFRMAWVGFPEQEEARRVRPAARAGHEAGYLEAVDPRWDGERGQGPVGMAIRTGAVQVVRSIQTDPAFAPWRVEATRRGYGSLIVLPLISGGAVLGVLAIYAAEPDAFDAEEVTLLRELADDLAYGITALRSRAERERAEEALRQQREALLRNERLAALGRLAAGVAHELKNPLSVIHGRVKLLEMDVAAGQLPPGEPLARHLKSLQEAEARMRRVMEGLSTYSKPPKPEPAPLDLGQLLAATRELLAYQARKSNVAVVLDVATPLPPVPGDRSRLMQVLLNLATNAVEAMVETGGELALRARLQADGAERRVRVEVADTGPGIPMDSLSRVWEPFYTTKAEGTGLGLSIVRGLVEEQPGATIELDSRPGEGTTFVLTFPVAAGTV